MNKSVVTANGFRYFHKSFLKGYKSQIMHIKVKFLTQYTRVGTLIVVTIYLQLI